MIDTCGVGVDPKRAPRQLARGTAPVDGPWVCDGMSFAQVYEQHGRAVFAVAQRTTAHLAEEVTQEVFVALWRNPARFDPARGSLRALLVTMARNRAIDRARSESSRSHREERTGRSRTGPATDHAAAVLAEELAADITAALARLSADCREAIVAAFYGGLTYTEVALALGAPEGTVKSRIRRGLSQLRAELEALGADAAAPGVQPA